VPANINNIFPGRQREVAPNNWAVDLAPRKSGHVVLEHPVRNHRNDSIPARIAKDPPKPLVYEALATLNRHFEQALWDLEQLRALVCFPIASSVSS
jgi:hypothetical protein